MTGRDQRSASAWRSQATAGDPKLSDLPIDKMRAALACANPDSRSAYQASCMAWFDALSDEHKALVLLATEAFADGNPAHAERIAGLLPPAPKFSLE